MDMKVSKVKLNEQYYTFKETGLVGPFTYTGGNNYCFSSFIRGDINQIALAKEAFDYLFQLWTFDSKRGEFVDQIADIMSDDAIAYAAKDLSATNDIQSLEALRDYRDVILRSVGVIQ